MQKVKEENLKVILNVVRKTTKAIKVFPFLYVVVFIILDTFITFCDYETAYTIADFFYESPFFIAFLIYLSYCVKLCFWHRLQCILPLIPQLLVFCDNYIYEYGEALATFNFVIIILLFILSLVNAYFVFIRPSNPTKQP